MCGDRDIIPIISLDLQLLTRSILVLCSFVRRLEHCSVQFVLAGAFCDHKLLYFIVCLNSSRFFSVA